MAGDEGELAKDAPAPDKDPKWSTPPSEESPASPSEKAPDADQALPKGASDESPASGPPRTFQAGPEAPVPMSSPPPLPPPPVSGLPPPAAPKKPPSFEELASKMGREIVKVSPVFRAAAVLVIAGALVLAAENALIFTGTVSFATSGGLNFGGLSASNNSSANATGGVFAGSSEYFARLSAATQLDIVGFALLGAGAIALGIGSRGVEFRSRFDGSVRKPSRLVLVFGIASGACSLLWVFLTVTWRTTLTGSATGDWSAIPAMFNVGSYAGGSTPAPLANFLHAFPSAVLLWVLATAIQVPAAALFYGAGWGMKRETGLKVGGASWIAFSVVALIGMIAFASAMLQLVGTILGILESGGGSGLSDALQNILTFIIVGAVSKLLLVPLWAIVSFLLLSTAGLRLLRYKPGRVVLGSADIKAITSTPSVLAPAAESPWRIPPGDLASGREPTPVGEPAKPPSGDIVVNLSGPVGDLKEPPK